MSAHVRQNFRVRTDFSRIFQDVRQHSWVFVDGTKVTYVNQLVEHIQKLFDINKPFYLLAKYDDSHVFLPFDEDVRVLENNDTILVVPDANNTCSTFNEPESITLPKNSFSLSLNYKQIDSQMTSEKSSSLSDKSFITENHVPNAVGNPSETSLGGSFYKTALYDTIEGDKNLDSTKENRSEDKSILDDSIVSVKRKRVRKRKQKKTAENVPESDTSFSESSNKKPKIIDSILIASGKHIRFEGIDDEVEASNCCVTNGNTQAIEQNSLLQNKEFETNKELAALLNLKYSSTPLTFSHKKKKKVYKPETIDEIKALDQETVSVNDYSNTTVDSLKALNGSGIPNLKTDASLNQSAKNLNNTVSFKVFRMAEDYTPQLSSIILAQVLSEQGSQYKLKILHGQDQLQDPQGKFSLPKEDEDPNETAEDIVLLDKSKLIEFTKVDAI